MNLIIRYFYVIVALVVLAAMPFSANFAYKAYDRYVTVKKDLEEAKNRQQHQQRVRAQLRSYRAFDQELNAFLVNSREASIEPKRWMNYDVNINDELMGVGEVKSLLNNATHASSASGSGYYFHPKLIRITSLFDVTLLPPDIQKLFDERMSRKQVGERPVPGEKVVVTLHGTYLVLQRL